MSKLIRKISIGKDYKNDAMHYAVGQEVYGGHTICDILEEEDKFFPEKKDPKTSRLCFVMNSPMGVPEDVRVIAWGLSLERPTMIKYRINNIRTLFGHKCDIDQTNDVPICRF